jgi:DNA-binding NtrC family response regulator
MVEESVLAHTPSKPSILIVEDDQELLESLKKFFEIKKFVVDCACTGCEAAEKIAAADYDVALIDIFLPDLNGMTLLPKFRRTIPATRKIIMTGYVTLENAIEAVNNGAAFFFAKPMKLNILLEVVNKQLQERAMELQLFQQKLEEFKAKHLEALVNSEPSLSRNN